MRNPFDEGSKAFMPLYLRILVGIALWFISYAIMSFIGIWLAATITGTSVMSFNLQNFDSTSPSFASGLKIIQLFSDFGLFIIPALILPLIIFQKGPVSFMGLQKKSSLLTFVLAICLALVIQPIVTATAFLNQHLVLPHFLHGLEQEMQDLENKNQKLMQAFLKMNGIGSFLINTLIIALVPAIAEEMFFRGFLQKAFQISLRKNDWAIVVTAFIFSFIHLEFYGFLPRFLLGLLLGYAYLWSGDIKVPILIHFTNNFLDLCLSYSGADADKVSNTQNSFGIIQVLFCFLSLFVLALLAYVFKLRAQTGSMIRYESNKNEH